VRQAGSILLLAQSVFRALAFTVNILMHR